MDDPDIHATNDFDLEQDDGWDATLAEINLNASSYNSPLVASRYKSYIYKDVMIKFPYEAYKSQQLMMEKMIEGLTTGENCLLESPTGTGKTAALLCALLGWQEDCRVRNDNCGKIIEASAEKFGGCTCGLIIDKERTEVSLHLDDDKKEWSLIGMTYFCEDTNVHDPTIPTNEGHTREDLTSDILRNSKQDALISSKEYPTPVKKRRRKEEIETKVKCEITERNLTTACRYCIKKYVYNRSKPPRIYYCTRTHSQISQVVKQLKGTAYKYAKMTTLASRVATCISDSAMKEVHERQTAEDGLPRNNVNISDVCREYKKNYFKRKKMSQRLQDSENFKDGGLNLLYGGVEPKNHVTSVDDKNIVKDKLPVCKYFDTNEMLRPKFEEFQSGGAFDFEDIKEKGRCDEVCPYFGSYLMHRDADIVFGSYNYLIDPMLRKSQGIKHINSVLVFDEAHNIEDICRSSLSYTFDVELFKTEIVALVTHLLNIVKNPPHDDWKVGPLKIHTLQKLQQIFDKWIENITKRGHKLLPAPLEKMEQAMEKKDDFVDKKLLDFLRDIEMSQMEVQASLELANEASDLLTDVDGGSSSNSNATDEDGDYYTNRFGVRRSFKLSSKVSEFLRSMKQSLDYLYEEEQDGVGGIKEFKGFLSVSLTPALPKIVKKVDRSTTIIDYNNLSKFDANCIFQIVCLNPAIGFRELKNSAYSIIVASGTLTPLNSFASELNTQFNVTLQADHVIPTSNVWAGVIANGPKNMCLTLTKDQQDVCDIQDEVGSIIAELCDTIPNGVLVFLPSYGLMKKLLARWSRYPERNSIMRRIERKKHVFIEESQDKKRFKEEMERYKEEVKGGPSWNGCVLFAVFRGKISEGIDFADEQARCVVTIGIPFSNVGSADIVSKRAYNDMRKRNERPGEQILSGSEWYATHAFRAMNQAFGRCVRHRNDWGALVLIDSRMGQKKNDPYISKWVKESLQVYHNFNEVIRKLNQFLRARKEQDKYRSTRKSIKIEYEVSNYAKETQIMSTTLEEVGDSWSGNIQDNSEALTQIVRGPEFLDDLATQQMDILSPPDAASTPLQSQQLSQVSVLPESSPEYSFTQEVTEILGSQQQQTQLHEEVMEGSINNDEYQSSSQSSPSIFGRSPSASPVRLNPNIISDEDSDEAEMSRVAEEMQRNYDNSLNGRNENHSRVLEQVSISNFSIDNDVSMRSYDENISDASSVSYHSSGES